MEPRFRELISPGYFATLGIRPLAGRFFAEGEHEAVAVIGYRLWQDRFGGDPGAVGQTIPIGAGRFTVIGVTPRNFHGIVMDWSDPPEVWAPVEHAKEAAPVFSFDIVRAWGMESYLVTVRLRPGVSMEQAQSQLVALNARLREQQGRWR